MRTINSIRNIIFGLSSQFISTGIAFLTRTVFIHVLGNEYLGIDGLFINILSILSLANLGFDSAIIFSLYKPLSEKNEIEIKAYMNLYKKVYRFVGLFILIVGLFISQFLPYIIREEVNIKENLVIIYILFLLNSSISYLYIYKQSILIANQQSYKISKIHSYFIIIRNLSEILILIISKNYLMTLLIQIIYRIAENIMISKKADQEFPYLKDKEKKVYLSKDKIKNLYKNVYSLLLYKISATVTNSTDNIIISYFSGVAYVGIYSNYLLIISTITTFISYIFSAITSSVGNLVVSESNDKLEFIFNEIQFISFWVYGFCSTTLYILLNDFIEIWIGENYLLNTFTVLIIIIDFYTTGMQNASTIYRNTTGLFNVGKYRPIISVVINLITSIILAPKLKIAGVLLGTIISRICVYFWFDPYVVHKYIFNSSIKKYFIRYLKYTIIVIFAGYITYLVCSIISISSPYYNLFTSLILCVIIPNLIFFIIFRNNKYLKYLLNIMNSIVINKNIKQ